MAAKTICSVPLDWTLAEYSRHTCFDGSHVHLSHAEVKKLEQKNIVRFLKTGASKRDKSVVQIQMLAERDDRWAGKPSRSHAAGEHSGTGLSARVGAYLAMRVRQSKASNGANHGWALVMLAQINNRPDREDVALVPAAAVAVNQSAY